LARILVDYWNEIIVGYHRYLKYLMEVHQYFGDGERAPHWTAQLADFYDEFNVKGDARWHRSLARMISKGSRRCEWWPSWARSFTSWTTCLIRIVNKSRAQPLALSRFPPSGWGSWVRKCC
jgi:hypothetical protein